MTQRTRRYLACWLTAPALVCASARAADTWGGALTLTSDYIFRGVSRTDGRLAAQADLHARSPSGWYAGAWVSTANPPPTYAASPEVDLYAGFGWALSERWATTLRAVRYLSPNPPPYSHYDATELSASLRFEDKLALSAAVSPDAKRYAVQGWSQRGQIRSYEASLRQTMVGAVAIVAAVGYYDTRALLGASYRAWDAGLSTRAGPIEVALVRFGVDAAARHVFGSDAADGRWVLTAAWRF